MAKNKLKCGICGCEITAWDEFRHWGKKGFVHEVCYQNEKGYDYTDHYLDEGGRRVTKKVKRFLK